MKFTVEVEEFYLEEGELATELKQHIKTEVVSQIRKEIKEQVDKFMDQYVKAELNAQLQGRVQAAMDEFIASGKVKDSYSSGKEKTVSEWLSESIRGKHADIFKNISERVKAAVAELQNRYDLLFASQLITKINGQGFLKEDVARLLLTEEGKS